MCHTHHVSQQHEEHRLQSCLAQPTDSKTSCGGCLMGRRGLGCSRMQWRPRHWWMRAPAAAKWTWRSACSTSCLVSSDNQINRCWIVHACMHAAVGRVVRDLRHVARYLHNIRTRFAIENPNSTVCTGDMLEPDDITFSTLVRGFGDSEPPQWGGISSVLAMMQQKFGMKPGSGESRRLPQLLLVAGISQMQVLQLLQATAPSLLWSLTCEWCQEAH